MRWTRRGRVIATFALLTACGGETGEGARVAQDALATRPDGAQVPDFEAPSGPDAAPAPVPDAAWPPDATPDAAWPPDATPDAAWPPDATPDAAPPPDPAPDAAPPPDPAPDAAPAPASLGAMSPAALFEALPTRDFRLINVHIPYAGEIPGTDVHIEYTDTAALMADLGPDRDRPAMVYCLTDHMALIAGAALVAEGYRRIIYLEGGMRAWVAAGYPLDRE